MKTRIITSVAILAVIVPVVLLSEYIVYPILISALAAIAVFEMLRALGMEKEWFVSVPAYLYAVAFPFSCFYVSSERLYVFLLIFAVLIFSYLLYLMAVSVFSKGRITVAHVAEVFFAVTYIVVSFSMMSMIRYVDRSVGLYVLILAFVAAWMSDVSAYFVGTLIGKHKLIPEVSPKKTVEGSLGGIIFAVLGLLLYGLILDLIVEGLRVNYAVLPVLGFILSIISQLGDLIASLIKREHGIKDYGKLLPGHGGIMDRFDSVLPVSTAILVICILFPPFAIS